ncbi:MAG: LytTR family DNA-binding domain-containing protein [Paraclostridium dentum]|uniref:LytTR family DNA-binding domain-containing protein n=1 Tax=Paraclostridium TaxID=1849822 RepID=UPI0018FED351|nr:LytTR family DNA-binding domain-containing protein [Paraclostridium bifermentans]MCU9809751.1 LytTR family transcriptional regulator [Paraclostridium sp. AKS46]MDM8129854.1 LytTR family DNA-binding domain-containing protein [Paraclostridium benzoelyticum]MDO7204389.1 LytTR family DNA-binding domain-containing protein [Paraclostridium bifermentans]GIM33514.1 transcriptional regulator [Paraclostridium bifermentans subsp. muricolitidis]
MKINILIDKILGRDEVEIKVCPENVNLGHDLENYIRQISKLTVINTKNDSKIKVNINDILKFQSEGNMCCVKMKSKELYLINKRLKEIDSLNYKNFVKINNQTIINLNEVKEFSSAPNARLEVILSDGSFHFVNRHYVKIIKERLL